LDIREFQLYICCKKKSSVIVFLDSLPMVVAFWILIPFSVFILTFCHPLYILKNETLLKHYRTGNVLQTGCKSFSSYFYTVVWRENILEGKGNDLITIGWFKEFKLHNPVKSKYYSLCKLSFILMTD
jgi:hypothetical protein